MRTKVFGSLLAAGVAAIAAETLPNGIRLETDPRDRTDMGAFGDKPLPVPYLAHRPAVIPVDLGRQLFVDDFLIENTTHLSKDGVHWGAGTQLGPSGDRSTIFYNPFRKIWVYSIRGGWHHRSRLYAESADFLGGATLDNRVRWLRADNQDRPAESHFYAFPDRTRPVFTPARYNFDVVAYESLMLGAFTIMTGPENNPCSPANRSSCAFPCAVDRSTLFGSVKTPQEGAAAI